MSFDHEIRRLCAEIIASGSEEETVELTRRMQSLLHGRIEEIRTNLKAVPPVAPFPQNGEK